MTTAARTTARAGPARVCRWPGCGRAVAVHHWGCARHWFVLPASIRTRLTETYRPRQARGAPPTAAWLSAHRCALAWIEEFGFGRAADLARRELAAHRARREADCKRDLTTDHAA